jgi:hypothetical protein
MQIDHEAISLEGKTFSGFVRSFGIARDAACPQSASIDGSSSVKSEVA